MDSIAEADAEPAPSIATRSGRTESWVREPTPPTFTGNACRAEAVECLLRVRNGRQAETA
jgi:hypothetical protein